MSQKRIFLLTALYLLLQGCATQPEQTLQSEPAIAKSVNSYVTLGFAYLERGNNERAKRAFIKAIDLDRDAADVLHGMALIYQKEGETRLAEYYFTQALNKRDSFSVARNNFAAFLYQEGRYEDACEQLKITVRDTLYANRQLAFENLGLCQLKLNQQSEAEESFKRALQLDRSSYHSSSRALLELADLKQKQNRPLDAWSYLQQHLEVAKTSKRSLMLGIQLAEQLGKRAERSRYLSELSRLNPSS